MNKIILNYLLGELTLEDRFALNKWLDEKPFNHLILEKLENYWKTEMPDLSTQREEVYRKIKKEMHQKVTSNEKKPIKKIYSYIKYAAIITLVSFLTIYAQDYFEAEQNTEQVKLIEKTSLPGQKITLKLPDGSTVKLNADSRLIVPERFVGEARIVELVGEAFFDVVPNQEKPFIINMADFDIEVKGTSFNVRAYPEDPVKTVAVRTGIVEVSREGRILELQKDEVSILSEKDQSFEKRKINDDDYIFSWINQDLIFENNSLDDVLKIISKWYGVEIQNQYKKTTNKLYTAKHEDNPTLQQVMESVAFVYELKYSINGNELMIK